jgi:hypothetical protein
MIIPADAIDAQRYFIGWKKGWISGIMIKSMRLFYRGSGNGENG